MIKLRWLKSYKGSKIGSIFGSGRASATNFVSQGYAEYVEEKKETCITKKDIEKSERVYNILREKKDNEPELNFEQMQAIKLEVENELPKLAKDSKEEGRKKQSKRIVNEIINREKDVEKKTKEVLEKEKIKRYNKLQKKHELNKDKFIFDGFDKYTNFLTITKLFIKEQPIYYDKSKIWWLWNHLDKRWERVDEVDLMNAIDEYTKSPSTNSTIKNEILEAFKRVGRKNKPKEPKKTWVQFKDKVYDFKEEYSFEATPEYFITNPIPHKVGKSKDTPNMDKIFEQWVGKEYVQTLYEIMAYCLITYMPIHRIFCLIGDGLNGKGTFLRLIEKLVGEDNKCATEIELLMTHRFETSKLYKKLVCIVGEIDKGIFRRTKTIKSLSGDDLIRFEFKGKDGFDGHNYAKPLIATNNLPETTDKTKGFYRRWTIVDFFNKFSEEKDILEDIPAKEFENFCNKSLEILKLLIKKGEFTNDGTIEERENKYEKHSNYINEFINMYCDSGEDYHIEFGDFCENYNEYLISEGMKKKSKIEIGRIIILKGYEKKIKKISSELYPTTKMCINGIKLKEALV